MRIRFNKKLSMFEKDNGHLITNDDYVMSDLFCNSQQRKREYNMMMGRQMILIFNDKYLHTANVYLTCKLCDKLIEAKDMTQEQYHLNKGYCLDCQSLKYKRRR